MDDSIPNDPEKLVEWAKRVTGNGDDSKNTLPRKLSSRQTIPLKRKKSKEMKTVDYPTREQMRASVKESVERIRRNNERRRFMHMMQYGDYEHTDKPQNQNLLEFQAFLIVSVPTAILLFFYFWLFK